MRLATIALTILALTMIMQASHLAYSARTSLHDPQKWQERNRWTLNGLLGSPVELLANMLRRIWVISLTIYFWHNQQYAFLTAGCCYSLFLLIELAMLVNHSLFKEISLFKKLNANYVIINLEQSSWFAITLIWLIKTY